MFASDTSSSNSNNNNNDNNNSNQTQLPQSPQPSADCTMTPSSPSPSSSSSSSPHAVGEEMALDCIFCLSSMPAGKPPLTEFELLAQLVPCQHFMHNECLKPWTEIANTCPICRVSFNQVNVVPNLTGTVINSWLVEDRVQRVTDHSLDIPPDGVGAEEGLQPDVVAEPPDAQTEHRQQQLLDQLAFERRAHRQWVAAWERLDADLEELDSAEEGDDDADYDDGRDHGHQRRQRQERMVRRRAVAAVQTGEGPNPFDGPAWAIPTTRPRATFPHLGPHMSKEESDSWKMMEIAERIEENSKKKRRISPGFDDGLLARMGVDLSANAVPDGRKFKRPRTKRDSQLPAINTRNINSNVVNNGESSSTTTLTSSTPSSSLLSGGLEHVASTAAAGTPSDAGSPSSGGIFTSLLEGIGKYQEVPIISAADISGCDLTRMRPISPDRSSFSSAVSRPGSPLATYSPFSPPSSRPTSPFDDRSRGRPIYSGSSSLTGSTRTPALSPVRAGRKRAWEVQPHQPSSPPATRVQSPEDNQPQSPGPFLLSNAAGESSASESETSRLPQQAKYSLTKESKADIVDMVSAALKPLYPGKISKETYTEVNKSISRRMYRWVSEGGIVDREQWHKTIVAEVRKETERL